MTSFTIVFVAFLVIQAAFAADVQGDGATILKPTSAGNGAKGVTVMSPSGQVSASSECATGSSCSAGHFVSAKVVGASCGCSEVADDCGCRKKVQYVEPEIKKEGSSNCGCHQEETCSCRDSGSSSHVAAEPKHMYRDACGCLHEAVCACRKAEFVQPELKSDCPCAAQLDQDCACSHLRRN